MADRADYTDSTAPATATEPPPAERRGSERRDGPPSFATVRDEDLEPHEGLRYIARLFKVLSIFLILLLIGEVVIGFVQLGNEAIPTLLVEATRLIVFAAFLWGAGDIAMMLIESNHDLRAARILLGRLNGKMQRLTDIEIDELERLAANPSLRAEQRAGGAPKIGVRRREEGDGSL
jgi:hypothetical protein